MHRPNGTRVPSNGPQRGASAGDGDIDSWIAVTLSGKHTKSYEKSQFLMSKSTISMAIFNSYVKLPEGNSGESWLIVVNTR